MTKIPVHENTKQRGFSVLVFLVIVVVIAGLGFGGWYVRKKNSKSEEAANKTSQASQDAVIDQKDETDSWLLATTEAKGFSMKVPDGWRITNYPGDYLAGTDVTYKPGKDAVVSATNTDYTGHALRFKATITDADDNAGLGPQWASPQPGVTESTQDFSIGSLHGKRYKAVFREDVRQTLYEYVFDIGNNRKLDIVYTIFHDENEKDDVATVEKAIKTIKLSES